MRHRIVRHAPAVRSAAGAIVAGATRFPRPLDVPTPPGADAWRELYAYSLPFGEDRRDYEESVFWFRETIHWPRVLRPFETWFLQEAMTSLSQFNHRYFQLPKARGLDFRILHGHCYLSPGTIEDPDEVLQRADAFEERAGFYYEHWDELYAGWMERIRALLAELESLRFEPLPDVAGIDEVVSGRGLGRSYDLGHEYRRMLDLGARLWQYHFEFLNLGYAAYLDYFAFCRSMVPDISDLHVARMVAGIDVDLFRPDQELRRLARLAVELAVDPVIAQGSLDDVLAGLAGSPGGRRWLAELENARHPWFNYSTGTGFYSDDAVWADRLDVPLAFVRSYVEQLRAGHVIDAPLDEIAGERDRLADGVRARLRGADLRRFDEKLRLARTVVHFVENHNFYVEHWGMSVLWRAARQLSEVFREAGFWPEVDDIFLLRTDEVGTALADLLASWSTATPAMGPQRWPAEIERRRAVLDACSAVDPPPALGELPEQLDEPFTVMLWGLTSESLHRWLDTATDRGTELTGFGASPGVVEGRARVVHSVADLDDLEDGEILVADLTSPSWAPVFARLAGTVTASGGMMCHVAIVCREYGLPAVTGVSGATQVLRTGQWVRVDGGAGTVTVLEG